MEEGGKLSRVYFSCGGGAEVGLWVKGNGTIPWDKMAVIQGLRRRWTGEEIRPMFPLQRYYLSGRCPGGAGSSVQERCFLRSDRVGVDYCGFVFASFGESQWLGASENILNLGRGCGYFLRLMASLE